MKALRLALVTPRYWPLVGGAETGLAALAEGLREAGHRPRIVTAQWRREWPAELVHREIPVVRLPGLGRRWWGSFRYQRALRQWLTANKNELDLVYVAASRNECETVVRALRGTRVPVVLRAAGGAAKGEAFWQPSGPLGNTVAARCRAAEAFVVTATAVADELRAAGFPLERTHMILPGVAVPEPRSAAQQAAARAALADADGRLHLSTDALLVVARVPLEKAESFAELVRAWPAVHTRYPQARLWLLGDGPAERELGGLVQSLMLTHRVIGAGVFDEMSDVLAAADLFLQTTDDEHGLLEAMAAGLPIVARDAGTSRELLGGENCGQLVPYNSMAIAGGVAAMFADRAAAGRMGAAARERVVKNYTLARCVAAHEALFAELVERKRQP